MQSRLVLVLVVSQQRHERELPEAGSPVLTGSVHNVVGGPGASKYDIRD